MVYQIPSEAYCDEILIKNSRFITHLEPVFGVDEVRHRLQQIRSRYPDCNHVCYAYIAEGPDSTLIGLSDDGEPSGTAGKPMLNILKHANVGHVLVGVARYFGGIKLGTGGLQRAYSSCTQKALLNTKWTTFRQSRELMLEAHYEDETTIRHILEKHGARLIDVRYEMLVTMTLHADEASASSLIRTIIDATAGRVRLIE